MGKVIRADEASAPGQKNKVDRGTSSRSVFVGQVPFDATEEEIHEIFSSCGEINHVRIPRNEKGQSRGIAYVTFEKDDAVEYALKFNKASFKKQTIIVQRSNPAKGERIKKKHEAESKKKTGKTPSPKEKGKPGKKKNLRPILKEQPAKTEVPSFEGKRAKAHDDDKNQSIKTYLKMRAHVKRKRSKSAGR
jgi:RNA recognition motif-containing protein